jgi:hypothetical protein
LNIVLTPELVAYLRGNLPRLQEKYGPKAALEDALQAEGVAFQTASD